MVKLKRIFILALLFIVSINISKSWSQTFQDDLNMLLNITQNVQTNNDSSNLKTNIKNEGIMDTEYKLFFLGMLKFYQTFISSQDMSVCNFTPSCSHFSEAAFKQTGYVEGFLLTSDRLQRCNGSPYHHKFYIFDPISQRYLDPVINYLRKN